VADPVAEDPCAAVGLSAADTAPRVLVSPSVMALPAPSPGTPSGTVPVVVLLGAKVESPESAWSDGAQPAAAISSRMEADNLSISSLPIMRWRGNCLPSSAFRPILIVTMLC
jgi:hypothetical protein